MTLKQVLLCGTILAATSSAVLAEGADVKPSKEMETVEEINVTGRQTPYIRLSETATKTGQDLLDTPMSVTMLNQAFLEDLRSETLADAYPYTLGLSQSGQNANSFTLRGLPSDLQNVQVNGLPGLASRFGSPTTANIERVEVLKGPASVLYGLMEPGGFINIVTKRPSAEASTTLSATLQSYASGPSGFGDDNGGTITFDSTGALSNDKRWLYRLTASAENVSSFRDGVTFKNVYLFPSVSYVISPEATATVGLEYVNEKGDADDGLVAVNNDINQTAALNVRYQEDGSFDNDEGLVAYARFEYASSEQTQIKLNYRSVFHRDERKLFENNRVNDAEDITEATLRRRDRHQINKRDFHFLDANISHRFETGGIRHNVLFGFNGGFERSDFERVRFGAAITPNISVLNPELGVGVPSEIRSGTDRITDRWNYGVYLQDSADLTDWLSVMVGARYDRQDVDFIEQVNGFTDSQTTEAFLPQAGIVLHPTEMVSVYASYTESFSPNSVERRDAVGRSFDPEQGNQYEIGIKAVLFDERLNLTLAAFDIEKTNIIETNIDGDYELLGALESKGIEFEVQAMPTENWQIRAGYAYADSIVSDSPNVALVGARNAFAPEHDLFFWTRYNYPNKVMGGILGASLGINYESERFTNANVATQVVLPGAARIDTGVYFDFERYRIALNIENLLDKKYYIGGTNDTRLFSGDPRLMTLSFKARL